MIVWLASFPRSGNTFFRIALHRLYQVPTYVVYDVDGVAEQIGTDLMDARDRPGTLDEMRASPEVHFVKTHRQRDDPSVAEADRAICLVRDGRDCVVSWARLWTAQFIGESDYPARFAAEARAIITRRTGGTASWGRTCSPGSERLRRNRSGCASKTSSPSRGRPSRPPSTRPLPACKRPRAVRSPASTTSATATPASSARERPERIGPSSRPTCTTCSGSSRKAPTPCSSWISEVAAPYSAASSG